MDIQTAISKFFREKYGIGSGHARELAAAILGYKSNSALLSSSNILGVLRAKHLSDRILELANKKKVYFGKSDPKKLADLPEIDTLMTEIKQRLRELKIEFHTESEGYE